MDVIREGVPEVYKKYLKTNFDFIIGGGCLLTKNPKDPKNEKPYRYITIYSEIKENKGNEIDFFLYIKDRNERNKHVNLILQNNLYYYFKMIKYNYKDEYKKIVDENKKEIGYIVRCNASSHVDDYLERMKALKDDGPKNVSKNLPLKDVVKTNQEIMIDSLISFFYQIDELTNYLTKNKNLDFQAFKNLIISKVGPNIKKLKNYQQIFEVILTGIDPNSQANKDYNDQSSSYDESKGLNKFMEKHRNGNIIQKLFLIPKEEMITCKKCGLKTYQFNYGKFIYIKNQMKEILYQKIFEPQMENNKGKVCNFCNGQETDYSIATKILDYPEKLIVIIDPTQVNNFNIGLNSVASNGVNLSYSLNQFIEAKTNILYQINPNNSMSCHPINKNVNENIFNKKPIVLFYNLIKINVPINMNSQINNNQFENQQMQQNFNQQNNFQNFIVNNDINNNNFQNNFNNNFQNNNFNNNFQNDMNNNFPMQFNILKLFHKSF